jgi:type II secretory pathway component PulM
MKRLPGQYQHIAETWKSRTLRERRVLLIGATLLAVLLIWWSLIDPALSTRKKMQEQLPELQAQSAQLQALAKEVAELPAAPPAGQPLSRQALEYLLTASGLKAQQITMADNTVTLNFSDVSFVVLTEWLQKVQREQQLFVIEATVTARERLDRVDATLSLQRPS